MFKAKRIDTNEIQTILDTFYDLEFHRTYFLVWSNNGWRWRPADKYVPPNVPISKLHQSNDIIDDDPPF